MKRIHSFLWNTLHIPRNSIDERDNMRRREATELGSPVMSSLSPSPPGDIKGDTGRYGSIERRLSETTTVDTISTNHITLE